LGVVGAASARAQVEPVRLVYHAYPGCPDEARFVEKVVANVPRARFAVGREPARTFVVAVRPSEDGSVGFVQVSGIDGAVSRRDVAGKTCDEVVSALALMATLAIDPPVFSTPERTAPLDEAGNDSGSPVAAVADEAETRASRPVSRADAGWRWGAGVDAQMLGGVVPVWAPGAGVFVDLESAAAHPILSSLRVSARAATEGTWFSGGVGANLSWITGRLEGCMGRVRVASLSATVCLDADVGVLASDGDGLANTTSDRRWWGEATALGRVAWPLGGGPWVEGSGGVGVPFERYTFYYQAASGSGSTAVYRVPVVGGELGLGLGYRFP
jgi:hypothetical protein